MERSPTGGMPVPASPADARILALLELAIGAGRFAFALFPPTSDSPRVVDGSLGALFVALAGLTWLRGRRHPSRTIDQSLYAATTLMALVAAVRVQAAGQALASVSIFALVVFAAYCRPSRFLWPFTAWALLTYGTAVVIDPVLPSPLYYLVAATMIVVTAALVSRLAQRIQSLATHDPLTGLLNRSGLESSARAAAAVARRAGAPVAVAVADLDRFKEFNDSRGHRAGDELLRSVGDQWRSSLRAGDVVARIGGDEFAFVFPMSDAEQATASLARLRLTSPFTWQFGATIWSAGEDLWVALDRADSALFAAKRDARGR